jgi:hypothetical protein
LAPAVDGHGAGKRLDDGAPDRRQDRLRPTVLNSFFPLRLLKTVMLQEGVGLRAKSCDCSPERQGDQRFDQLQ